MLVERFDHPAAPPNQHQAPVGELRSHLGKGLQQGGDVLARFDQADVENEVFWEAVFLAHGGQPGMRGVEGVEIGGDAKLGGEDLVRGNACQADGILAGAVRVGHQGIGQAGAGADEEAEEIALGQGVEPGEQEEGHVVQGDDAPARIGQRQGVVQGMQQVQALAGGQGGENSLLPGQAAGRGLVWQDDEAGGGRKRAQLLRREFQQGDAVALNEDHKLVFAGLARKSPDELDDVMAGSNREGRQGGGINANAHSGR